MVEVVKNLGSGPPNEIIACLITMVSLLLSIGSLNLILLMVSFVISRVILSFYFLI